VPLNRLCSGIPRLGGVDHLTGETAKIDCLHPRKGRLAMVFKRG